MTDFPYKLTKATYHPLLGNFLNQKDMTVAFSTSQGCSHILDYRKNMNGSSSDICFENNKVKKNYWQEDFEKQLPGMKRKLEQIDELKISPDGNILINRDFFNVYAYDVRMSSSPIFHKGTS